MTALQTYSTMVVGIARADQVDPGSEVVVRQEGEQKGGAEDWTARSKSSSAHQLVNILIYI